MRSPIPSCGLSRTLLLAVLLTAGSGPLVSAPSVALGTAASFAVLGNTQVTNTGATALFGDLGVSAGTIDGFPPGLVFDGATYLADPTTAQARADASAAFDQISGMTLTQDLTGENLGSRTLSPGVYFYSAAAGMTGVLVLDGLNQPDPVFVFQIGSALTTGVASISLINGATAGNVWFGIGSSATFGTGSSLSGTFIAFTSQTVGEGVGINGRVFALNGAITLADNQIVVPSAVPEPASTALLASGLALWAVVGLRARKRAEG